MKYTLCVYEKAMPNELGWEEKLRTARETGFDAVEMSVDESDWRLDRLDWDAAERKKLLNMTRDAGVPFHTMCLSAHRRYPIGDKEGCARGMEILQKAVRLSSDLGIRIIQLAGYDSFYNPSTPDTVARFGENLVICAREAAAFGVLLGFETMETPFMNTAEKAMRYVKAVDSPYLQVYPDIGNIRNATEAVEADLETARGHIVAAHLKETREGIFRNLRYGEGRVDFAAGTRKLRELGVGLYNAEFWYDDRPDWKSAMAASSAFLRKHLDA